MTPKQVSKYKKLSLAALMAGKRFRDSSARIGSAERDALANAWIDACKRAEQYLERFGV